MRKLLLAALIGSVVILPLHAAFATKPDPDHKVTLCHRTGSASNPYIVITTDIASDGYVKGGHNNHEQVGNGLGGDIIPAYTYQDFSYPGKNLDTDFGDGVTGADILANGCEVPESSPPPTTPPPTSPPPTSPPPSVTPPVINPAADITVGNCEHRQFQVFLDNSASTDGSDEGGTAQFFITVNGEQFADVFNVAAGDTTEVDVPVADGDIVTVTSPEAESNPLVSAQADLSTCVHGSNGTPPPPSNNGGPTPSSLPVTL